MVTTMLSGLKDLKHQIDDLTSLIPIIALIDANRRLYTAANPGVELCDTYSGTSVEGTYTLEGMIVQGSEFHTLTDEEEIPLFEISEQTLRETSAKIHETHRDLVNLLKGIESTVGVTHSSHPGGNEYQLIATREASVDEYLCGRKHGADLSRSNNTLAREIITELMKKYHPDCKLDIRADRMTGALILVANFSDPARVNVQELNSLINDLYSREYNITKEHLERK